MNLKLQYDAGDNLVHFLEGKEVADGSKLEMIVADLGGTKIWEPVTYRMLRQSNRLDFKLFATFGVVTPNDLTVLRWPVDQHQAYAIARSALERVPNPGMDERQILIRFGCMSPEEADRLLAQRKLKEGR